MTSQFLICSLFDLQVHGKDAVMCDYDSDDSISEPASTHNTTNSSLASPISTNTPNNHHNNQHNNNNNNNNSTNSSNNHLGISSSGLLTPSSVAPSQSSLSSQTSLSHFPSHHGLSGSPNSSHMQHQHRFDYGRPMADTTNSLGGLSALNQVHSTSSASSFDFKPQHLADWYSHAHMGMGMMGVPRYDTMTTMKPVSHHVTSALPTPPSSGHSPISHLSNHLHQLLPSTTSAYT